MKRSIALALVLVMVLAMVPGANAATQMPRLEIETKDVLELTTAPDRYETMSGETLVEGCWIVPRFEVYGQARVIGDRMTLETRICDESLTSEGYCGVQIYKGTYDKLTESSEPVYAYAEHLIGGHPSYTNTFYWQTEGCSAGDYTAIFFLADDDENVVMASAADLFLSKKEIPITGIDLYVYELDDTPDVIYCADNGAFSVGVVFEPYHTTVYRWDTERDFEGLTNGGSDKPDYASRFKIYEADEDAPFVSVDYIDYGVSPDPMFTDRIDVVVRDRSELVQFSRDTAASCDGQVVKVDVTAPEGISEVQVRNMNPYTVEIVKIEGNSIYLRGLLKGEGEIVVCYENMWDWLEVYCGPHYYRQEYEQPTCTEEGYEQERCRHCDDIINRVVKPARGHAYGTAGTRVVIANTATKDGLETGYCSRCRADVETVIPRIFSDTEPDRFYSDALDYCYENGIINGLSADTFGPGATLNRAQLVTMLYRHAGSPAVEQGSAFTDVAEGTFYTAPVAWASANGIVNGYSDGTFRPADAITREQIVTMIYRYVAMLGKDNGARDDLSAFTDLDMLRAYAEEPMRWAVANGVINGLSETLLGPQESANRAQTATILCRVITGILEAE